MKQMKQIKKTELSLLNDLISTINNGKNTLAIQVNSTLTLVFWQVGKKINDFALKGKRADYGKEVIKSISKELVEKFGRSFSKANLHRMMQFTEKFNDYEKVVTLSRQLSWSHFLILIPLKTSQKQLFYTDKIAEEQWSVRHTRKQIERKSFERTQIATIQNQLSTDNKESELTVFKDPYFLDFLGLKQGYLENDLEAAILKELEDFIVPAR